MKYALTVVGFLLLSMPGLALAAQVSSSASISGNTAIITIHSDTAIPNALVDAEVYGNGKISQAYTTTNIPAGSSTCTWNVPLHAGGPVSFELKVGVFSANWSTLYNWNDNDASTTGPLNGNNTFTCTNPPPAGPITSSVQTTDGLHFSFTVLSDHNISNALMDTEIIGGPPQSTTKLRQIWSVLNLTANQPMTCTWQWWPPLFGGFGGPNSSVSYTFKTGVFSSDWSQLYNWNGNAGSYASTLYPGLGFGGAPFGVPPQEPMVCNGEALGLPNQTLTAGAPFSFSFGQNVFTMGTTAYGDFPIVDYSASLTDNSPLPDWLHFASSTRTFSGTAPADSTTLHVRVTADSLNPTAAYGYPYGASSYADFTITVGPGSNGTSDKQGHIAIIKRVVNTGGGTKSAGDFEMNIHALADNSFYSTNGSETGVTIDITPGQYIADEDHVANGVAGYTEAKSADCSGTIAAGGHKTCTITNTWVSTTTPQNTGTIDQNGQSVRAGTSIDFSGHNFGHEESVVVSLNGATVATAHADGGGNFSTGSLSVPTTVGTYTYTFTGQTSGITGSATITVVQ